MTIRLKLTLAFIAVILVANAILAVVAVAYIGDFWLGQVQEDVRLDLNSARYSYQSRLENLTRFLEAAALDQTIADALRNNRHGELSDALDRIHDTGGMDQLILLDAAGNVLLRAGNPNAHGDEMIHNPIINKILQNGTPVSGTVIVSPDQLARSDPKLADQARFELLPTPAAIPTDDRFRNEGMALASAVPFTDDHGKLVGILYGANLLNRRYEIVDSIRDQVFPHELYEGRQIGTVTIFQGDLRINTNVRREDGERAVGTRLSKAVYETVLAEGHTWAAPAFVVNEWYISAYEPIRNPDGQIIGALYVGLLQAPFLEQIKVITWAFVFMLAVTTTASLVMLFITLRLVLAPIGGIISMARRVIAGDLSARTGRRPPGEIGLLCQAIDSMADAVTQREEQLKLATRQQIGRSEKLASVGRLAAGIAHEINNPLTGVLTFAHLLRSKANLDDQDRQDLDLIINETSRVAEIVSGLLDFAREHTVKKEALDINEAISLTVRLIRNQKQFREITIEEQLSESLPEVRGDKNQFQQVLLNLTLNACEAMPEGGTLTLRTYAEEQKAVVEVIDTGCGISPQDIDRIFDPFFSTKPVGKGTGLGLSVSYGIIEQHGGTLEVHSEPGSGTTFTVTLPITNIDGPSAASPPTPQQREPQA